MKLQARNYLASLCAASAALWMLSAAALPVLADTDEEEIETFVCGDYTYSLMVGAEDESEQAACIEAYTGEIVTSLVLPETLDGYPVVALGDTAFVQCQWLVDVTLPSTMIGIGTSTFADCAQLSNYYVADGNTYFESIDGVLYAEDGTYLVRYPIGRGETEITVPDGVYDIGYVAFAYHDTLETIHLPDSLRYIGAWAFADCDVLNHVVIPEKVTELEEFVFYRCFALDDITLPDTIEIIGDGTFASTALAEFTIPPSCTTIGQATFANTKMTEITIPETVTSIDFSAFGWMLDIQSQLYANTDFVIYGVAGTVAEQYATDKENGNMFTFIEIDAADTATTSSATKDDNNSSSTTTITTVKSGEGLFANMTTGRLIGVIVSAVLLIGVIVGGIIWSKKK